MIKAENKEIWRIIPSYPKYEVSNMGRVRHKERKTIRKLTPYGDNKKYRAVCFNVGQKKTKTPMVHRLVAEAFLTKIPNKPMVLHKDGDGSNNNVSNLYYGSAMDNKMDSRRLNEIPLKFSEHTIQLMRKDYKDGMSTRKIAKKYGSGKSTVHNYVSNKKRTLPYDDGSL